MSEKETRVAIVGGMRTPFVKAGTLFRDQSPLKLSSHAVRGLLNRYGVDGGKVDRLIWGRVIHDPRVPNLAREIVFDLNLPAKIHAELVSNNCITGIHAMLGVVDAIRLGRAEIGIAGGVDSMSNPPVLFGREATSIFMEANAAKSGADRTRALLKLRPRHFKPHPPSVKEPSTGLTMGEHAEITAKEWGISRQEQDEIALRSHQRAAAATQDGRLMDEIHPLNGVNRDTIIRADVSMEKLGQLKPVFDKENGTITPGNASPLTDGASSLLLMSAERAEKEGLKPLAFVRAVEFAAHHPDDGLLMAPALAVPRLLRRTGLSLEQIGIVEVHEAFGAQVACNLKAWEQGWKEDAIGRVDPEKLNPQGSSIAVGHPFGATGTRILTTLAREMERRNERYGLVSICAAGAMAAAVILERDV